MPEPKKQTTPATYEPPAIAERTAIDRPLIGASKKVN